MYDFGEDGPPGKSRDAAIIKATRGCIPEIPLSQLRQSSDCIKLISRAGRIVFMNESVLCVMKLDSQAAVAGKLWWDLWPQSERETVYAAFESALGGSITEFTGFCPTKAGEPTMWHVSLQPVLSPAGRIDMLLVTSRIATDADMPG